MEIDSDTRELVARALLEDLGAGDVTAEAVVPEDASGRATITQKAPGVLFGLDVAGEVFRQAGAGELEAVAAEGEWRDEVPAAVARAAGPARALLAAERTALNLLCHLSGVATLTARFVRAVEGTGRQDPRHAQDDPGTAGAGEGRGGGGRRDQPPDGPLRRDPDQGEPRRRSRAGWGRRCGVPARRSPACRSRSSAATSRRFARARGRGRPAAARQHEPGRAAGGRRRRARVPAAPSSRPRAGSRSRTSPKSPQPASISSRSAR